MVKIIFLLFSSQEATKNISFPKIQRGLQYLASTVFQTSPKTPADVQKAFNKESVFKNFGLCRQDQHQTPFFKVCHEQKDFAYCVFASDKCVQLIKENIPVTSNRKILIDGTFAVVPIGCFQQLLLINVEYLDRVCICGIEFDFGKLGTQFFCDILISKKNARARFLWYLIFPNISS